MLPILAEVFDALPVGVIVLDADGRVVIFNHYEERLARRKKAKVLGRAFFEDVAPCMNVKALGVTFREKIGKEPIETLVEFSFPFPFLDAPRDVTVNMRSFEANGAPYAMLVVEDVSAQRAVQRMKDELSRLVVHDLKNPLAIIHANLWFIEREAKAPTPRMKQALEDTSYAATRLQAMLLNLLDVTRLQENSLPLAVRSIDIGDVISRVTERARALGARGAIELAAELETTPMHATFDEDVLVRAIENLVENAIRHAKSRVIVRARREGANQIVEVEDDGPGVPVDERDNVFEPYAQLGGGKTSGHNRGLGLTFVRLAVRAHHGHASVHEAKSGGACFRLSFPAEASTPQS